MRKWLLVLVVLISSLFVLPVHASLNNFYFKDFMGDYYLSKDESGISHLRVVENVTVVFPDYNQNKGICRQIPFTNQDGANVTLPRLNSSDIVVLRNGESEPIYSISKDSNYYNVCTGTDEYVLGEQVYTFEYNYEKVVTDFGNYQELYWDTNGNGAPQRFDLVTARVHFENMNDWTGESWCYVGKYGENNQDRCTTSNISDGVEFTASNLMSYENLTFDAELKPGSFVVPGPSYNYVYVWLTVALGVLCALVTIRMIKKYMNSREKANYYNGFFVKPEYQPDKNYSLPEMTEIFMGKKKDVKVAMLLELAVKHKINFIKGEKKKWSIEVKNLDKVDEEYLDLLAILNNGSRPATGDTIEVKRHSASNQLITLRKSMESKILGDLKKDKLVEEKYHIGGSGKYGVLNIIVSTMVLVPVLLMCGVYLLELLDGVLGLNNGYGQVMVFREGFGTTAIIMIAVTVVVCTALSNVVRKYAGHTMEGLKASRYMDGLRLYIEMAEAERMKFLQSVEGADTSVNGIVKLYEKLLPYAAVFGLEESWINEMKEYCKVEEIEEPNYLLAGLAASEISRGLHNAANYATNSTTMSSSGGGSSSGFSGGGGGGFSGGGGGGGGFSGR